SSQLWEEFNQELVKRGLTVETGEFGADMKVETGKRWSFYHCLRPVIFFPQPLIRRAKQDKLNENYQ
ncbi:hypothetical protein SB57_10065, partial [Lactobacillus delbrueckii subsp. bulgaricus]